ncbi:geranylgeranylglycerol-phosphate geranylgeranyltransferase [Acidilobus sp.]|uniref:geranylgeranylglycerol-phosphate geranylgeranyltransferase n=1 Tax=Acidilobus sp. TaxID=1872109 RepID=UPI003CFF10F3
MSKVTAYAELMRPVNGVMMGIIVIVGAFVAGRGRLPSIATIVMGFLVAYTLTSSAMILNDIVDVKIDMVNSPRRPIPSGRVSVAEAKALFWLTSAVGLIISAVMGLPELAVAAVSYVDAVLYDTVTKRTGLLGNFMVAFTGVSPLLYGALMGGGVSMAIVLETLMIFLSMVGREIAKGIADVEGDRLHGVRTLAVVHGPAKASLASMAFYLAAIALSPLPPLLGIANPLYYGVPIAAVDLVFIYESLKLVRSPTKDVATRVKDVELYVVPLALLGFALGALG